MHGGIQVCPIEPTRLLVKELKEAGKTNIDMVEWEQVLVLIYLRTELIFVTTNTTGAGALFGKEKAKF